MFMYQFIQGILVNFEDNIRIIFVWGVNGDRDIFFKKEFVELQLKYLGRFRVEYVVFQLEVGLMYCKGYVNGKVFEEFGLGVNEVKNKSIKVMICGLLVMEKVLKGGKGLFVNKIGVFYELGYKFDQIYSF